MTTGSLEILESIKKCIQVDTTPPDYYLSELGRWVQLSASDEEVRQKLANDDEFAQCIVSILRLYCDSVLDDYNELMARLVRGVLVLVRNVIPAMVERSEQDKVEKAGKVDKANDISLPQHDQPAHIHTHISPLITEITLKFIDLHYLGGSIIGLQCLCNLSNIGQEVAFDTYRLLCPLQVEDQADEFWDTWIQYVRTITSSERFVAGFLESEYFDGFVLTFKRISKHNQVDDSEFWEPSRFTIIGLRATLNIISNERFSTFLLNRREGNDEVIGELLWASQILVGGKETGWTQQQQINITAWLLDYLKVLRDDILAEVQNEDVEIILKRYESRLAAALDCISSLLRFQIVVNMLNSYNFLQDILDLFKVVCRKKKKGRLDEAKESIDDNNRSGIKCMLVEIISYLVHGNFKGQELVRTEHCLELVLDSSNLDLDEPFIRERAIVCIRTLLENNPGNQDFIANLAVQGVEMDEKSKEIMRECGYSVETEGGKVKVERKASGAATRATEGEAGGQTESNGK
ncbi:DEKNAAC103129 [Brettanomyces naardenensis]|uniref:Ataxin-10 homolog n=1 Tax=Brettanomyces naardenensis TaxID=13370 RepID=A0A448YMI7_BRENA|nr:DEKNAAC103129 [Brettanomyces naardenensis]